MSTPHVQSSTPLGSTTTGVFAAAFCSPAVEQWLIEGDARWMGVAAALGVNHPDYIEMRKCAWAYRLVLEELRQANDQAHLPPGSGGGAEGKHE
jgi:hypothetical protein